MSNEPDQIVTEDAFGNRTEEHPDATDESTDPGPVEASKVLTVAEHDAAMGRLERDGGADAWTVLVDHDQALRERADTAERERDQMRPIWKFCVENDCTITESARVSTLEAALLLLLDARAGRNEHGWFWNTAKLRIADAAAEATLGDVATPAALSKSEAGNLESARDASTSVGEVATPEEPHGDGWTEHVGMNPDGSMQTPVSLPVEPERATCGLSESIPASESAAVEMLAAASKENYGPSLIPARSSSCPTCGSRDPSARLWTKHQAGSGAWISEPCRDPWHVYTGSETP